MLWRRRSPSLSDDSVSPVRIEHLNSRFRLRIPMTTNSNIQIKNTSFHSDDSTCSTRSSRTNQSATCNTAVKHVRFSDHVVEFLPTTEFPSEASMIWFSQEEVAKFKIALRDIYKGSHINDAEFVTAVNAIRRFFEDNGTPITTCSNEAEYVITNLLLPEQILLYKEYAHLLATNEGRGLERMYYGSSTFSKVGAKSQHIKRHIASVLATQDKAKDTHIDKRADSIAAHCQCQTQTSVVWARILAMCDLESVNGVGPSKSVKIVTEQTIWEV
jgi:hypothetical protein